MAEPTPPHEPTPDKTMSNASHSESPPKPEKPGLAQEVGQTIGQGVDTALNTAVDVGTYAGKAVQLSVKAMLRGKSPLAVLIPAERHRIGSAAGFTADELSQLPKGDEPVNVQVIDYGAEYHHVQNVKDLQAFLEKSRDPGTAVRWINIDGLGDPNVLSVLARKYHLHPLALEDVLHMNQRAKIEVYPPIKEDKHATRLFTVLKMLHPRATGLQPEQLSVFLGNDLVVTFQERSGDIFNPVRERIERESSRIRHADASFLYYALIDAAVDQFFPLVEQFAQRLEALEIRVENPSDKGVLGEVRSIRQDLLMLRREVWPLREIIHQLQRDEEDLLSEQTQVYLRDVYDHAVQVIDLLETYREFAAGLSDAYMNAVSHRMNEIMKVLTIIGSLFLPISFLAGVFGMNFERIPGLQHPGAFAFFCVACLAVVFGMLWYFRRRGWV